MHEHLTTKITHFRKQTFTNSPEIKSRVYVVVFTMYEYYIKGQVMKELAIHLV